MTKIDIPDDVVDGGDDEELAPLFDIDELIAAKLATAEKAIEIVARMKMFGAEWDLVESANALNAFRMTNYGKDPMAIVDYMLSLVHPNQREAFHATLVNQAALPTEVILEIFNRMMEAVAKRPTSPSSAKPSGSRNRRRSTNSTAG